MAINYVLIVGDYFPGTIVSCAGDPTVYNDLVWVGVPITEADLITAALTAEKTAKIIELSVIAEDEIVNGFPSSALLTENWYDSEPEDQLNLIGSVASGDDMYYAVRDAQDGTKSYTMHTNAQMQTVLQDGRNIKLSILQKFTAKKDAVLLAADSTAVAAITWTSVE